MTKEEIQWWELRTGEDILNPHEFEEGMIDCREDNKFRGGMGAEYVKGFRCMYEYNKEMEKTA